MEEKIEKLFWKLLEARAKPSDPLKEVLGKIFEKKKDNSRKELFFFFSFNFIFIFNLWKPFSKFMEI